MTMQAVNDIHTIVVHCTATGPDTWVDEAWIDKEHAKRGFPTYERMGTKHWCGYHFLIRRDGTMEKCRPMTVVGAHVKGQNTNRIGVALAGGIDTHGKPVDNFTEAQMDELYAFLWWAKGVLPSLRLICGHRDFSPDLDGDGIIERNEWMKECPCFDVGTKLDHWGLARYHLPAFIDVKELLQPIDEM